MTDKSMSLHIILLSGMDARDTTSYLIKNNFQDVQVLENQIQRYTRVIGKSTPVRITVWVALNTKLVQNLLYFIKYRIKNIIFLYNMQKPLTLIRAKGWWELICSYNGRYNMVLCSTMIETPIPTRAYDNMISHIANKFIYDNNTIPHYTTDLLKIFKKFLNA